MTYKETCEQICTTIKDITGCNKTFLSFSRGKDSIATWLAIREHFEEVIPVYFYFTPELDFVNENLAYYEDFFKTKIHKLPSEMFFKMLNSGLFQTWQSWNGIKEAELPNIKSEQWFETLGKIENISPYNAIGIKLSDSINRRIGILKCGGINKKNHKYYPIYDITAEEMKSMFRFHNIKLPIDYRIWGRSFDGLQYKFIKPLKEHFPQDYKKIKSWFPLIDIEILRYERV